ncbi:hypothetical protein NL676_027888 [Syzygium grande]|nr:hypothetical protein NL676_027888 [Syzygium grande]
MRNMDLSGCAEFDGGGFFAEPLVPGRTCRFKYGGGVADLSSDRRSSPGKLPGRMFPLFLKVSLTRIAVSSAAAASCRCLRAVKQQRIVAAKATRITRRPNKTRVTTAHGDIELDGGCGGIGNTYCVCGAGGASTCEEGGGGGPGTYGLWGGGGGLGTQGPKPSSFREAMD